MSRSGIAVLMAVFLCACQRNQKTIINPNNDVKDSAITKQVKASVAKPMADAATVMARKEVPVLCYHQIRNWTSYDSKTAREIIVPVDLFKAQLKLLADSGYQTILPDQLYEYLAKGAPLPPKPFMITFDDTDDDQYNIAWPEMKKYGFKGVFFIMTVSLNRPRYMTTLQVKQLSEDGNVIASHTWDHHMFTQFKTLADWEMQVEKPRKKIEVITGKPANYFAFPYGIWNKEGIPELKKRGIKAAFQLSTPRDSAEPLFTIRRMIASGNWSAAGMYKSMLQTFHLNN